MSSKAYLASIVEDLGNTIRSGMTGTPFDKLSDAYSKQYRRLTAMSALLGPMPEFLRGGSDLYALWHDAGFKELKTYADRRQFLRREYTDYYEKRLESLSEPRFEDALAARDIAIIREIGSGGFSVVFEGEHVVLGNRVAVKKLDPLFADANAEVKALRRFAREAGMLAMLNHKNIVRFRDGGFAGSHAFLIADLAPGRNLQTLLSDDGTFSEEDAICVVSQVLDGVQAAHEAGIVHRDLKPTNVMWDGTSATVLDFGAGQWIEQQISTRLTSNAIGTHGYMADELLTDPLLVDPNLDCYSVGVMLHNLLTGRIPNAGDPTYYLKSEGVSKGLTDVVLRAIAPPSRRYATALAMSMDLRKLS